MIRTRFHDFARGLEGELGRLPSDGGAASEQGANLLSPDAAGLDLLRRHAQLLSELRRKE